MYVVYSYSTYICTYYLRITSTRSRVRYVLLHTGTYIIVCTSLTLINLVSNTSMYVIRLRVVLHNTLHILQCTALNTSLTRTSTYVLHTRSVV